MPTLLLLRHGKSDWKADFDDDRLRPLARRGQKGARTIGAFMARTGHVPDSAISSPARRAQATLELAMAAGAWTCPVRIADALYDGAVPGLLAEIRREPAATGVLLAVGHEPTWSEVAALLVGGGRIRLPTGALARIDLGVERWDEVAPGAGVLAWSVVPRLLQAAGV
jgi:phosphohistidine phosphatase